MKATLVVLLLCVFAATASAATMTPLSDASLSAVSAAGGPGGGPGGNQGSDELDISIDIDDEGQEKVDALNLINAGGPVQVGTNILVVSAECVAGIAKAGVEQTVVNIISGECSICEFDEVELEVDIDDQGQQDVDALNLINTTGSAQVGTNIAVFCSGGAAGIYKAGLSQCVVNKISAGGGCR